MYIHMYTYICSINTYVQYVYIYICTNIYVCRYMYTYIYIYVHVYIYIYMYTHIRRPPAGASALECRCGSQEKDGANLDALVQMFVGP